MSKKYPDVWQVPLNLKYAPRAEENVPYSFTINIVGFFKVDPKWSKDKIEPLVHINAPAVLYSASRELISIMTGRGPWGPILLPSVNFIPTSAKSKQKT